MCSKNITISGVFSNIVSPMVDTQPSQMFSHLSLTTGTLGGPNERRLINDLTANYNKLERPVANESEAVVLKFGLTLQQIMDVVSLGQLLPFCSALQKNVFREKFSTVLEID